MSNRQIIEETDSLVELAEAYALGGVSEFDKQREEIGLEIKDLRPGVGARPEWERAVDEIEEPFVSEYDEIEYEQNRALLFMNGQEVGLVASVLGIDLGENNDKQLTGKKVLDLGCGTGRFTVLLSRFGADVTAIDATRGYIEKTAEKLESAGMTNSAKPELYVASAADFPLANGEYDSILAMFGVLNHVEDGWNLLSRYADALKRDGSLIVSAYGPSDAAVFSLMKDGSLPYAPSILQRREPGGIRLGDDAKEVLPATFPSPGEIAESLDNAGFDVMKTVGMLRLAAIFPASPDSESISQFMEVVAYLEPGAVGLLEPYVDDYDKLLMASYLADQEADSQSMIDDFAYIGFVAVPRDDNSEGGNNE